MTHLRLAGPACTCRAIAAASVSTDPVLAPLPAVFLASGCPRSFCAILPTVDPLTAFDTALVAVIVGAPDGRAA